MLQELVEDSTSSYLFLTQDTDMDTAEFILFDGDGLADGVDHTVVSRMEGVGNEGNTRYGVPGVGFFLSFMNVLESYRVDLVRFRETERVRRPTYKACVRMAFPA